VGALSSEYARLEKRESDNRRRGEVTLAAVSKLSHSIALRR
jgi:hypothetical protein